MQLRRNFLSVLAALCFSTAMTDLAAAGWQDRLDRELAEIATDPAHPLASLSTLAMRDGKVAYQRQFGNRVIDNAAPRNGLPADRTTLYRIASLSKLVTTLGVMKLVEDGKLALDADAGMYLGYPLRNPHFPDTPITLRMLLSHTSSLRDDAGYYWEAKRKVDLKDVLVPGGAHYGKGEAWAREAGPGAKFQYANFPWGVIGTIMERAIGERFDRLMRRLILEPMGLHGGFHPADFSRDDLQSVATLYRKRVEVDGKEIWDTAGPWVVQVDDYRTEAPQPRAGADYAIGTNGTLFGPQGNCRLSAEGVARIMRMLMDEGMLDGRRILKKESVAEMLKTQWRAGDVADGGNGMYAWGLGNQQFQDIAGARTGDRLVDGGGFRAVGHRGDAWGLTAAMVFDPETRNGMIFLTGGPGFDPATYPGAYSAMYRHEEKILTALYRRAILMRGD